MLCYVMSFFIYSVVIWLYNAVSGWIIYPDSGFSGGILYGPYSPFYAALIMLVMLLFNLIKKYGKEKDINPTLILLICMSVVLFGVFEYLGALIYEWIFGAVPWDYSGRILNINGRICCENTIFLTVFEVICVYFAQPYLNKNLNKLWPVAKIIISMAVVAVLLTDVICTFMK